MNLLSSMLTRDYSPIGLDIGHDAIKMLQLRRRGDRWQVSAGAVHRFGADIRQSPCTRWRFAAQTISSILAGAGPQRFRGRHVVASLDHEQVLVKNARLPKMPAAELAEAVRWEAADRFPFEASNALIRHLLAGEVRQGGEVRQELLIFAAADATVRDMLATIEQCGCKAVGLDAQPVALARATNYFLPPADGPDQDVQAVVDIGGRSCQVLITRGGEIVFVKTVEIGCDDLNRAIIDKVGTSYEDTEALRQRYSGQEPADEQSKVYRAVVSAVRPIIDKLAHEITLCLRYYSVTFRGNRPEQVLCVGGGTHDRLLLSLLGESLGLKVQPGLPLLDCEPDWPVCQWGAGPEAGGPEWAVALGCCLKPIHRDRPAGSNVPAIAADPAGVSESADAVSEVYA